ncbi:hypothetical protein NKG94_00545 [Micromonospora sp. M12]
MRTIPGTSIPVVVVPLLLLAVVFGSCCATAAGRALYAMGNNDQAATFTGVSVARTSSGSSWSPERCAGWSVSSGPCGTPAPAATTPPAWS